MRLRVNHVKLLLRYHTFLVLRVRNFFDLTVSIQSTLAARIRRQIRAYALVWASLILVTTITDIAMALLTWSTHVLGHLHLVYCILLRWVPLGYLTRSVFALIVLREVFFQLVHSV